VYFVTFSLAIFKVDNVLYVYSSNLLNFKITLQICRIKEEVYIMNKKLKYLNPNDYKKLSESFQVSNLNTLEHLKFEDFIKPMKSSIPHLDFNLLKELYLNATNLESSNKFDSAIIIWDKFDNLLSYHLQFKSICNTDSFEDIYNRFAFELSKNDRILLKILYDLGLYYEKHHAIIEAEKIWSRITDILKPYIYQLQYNKFCS